MGTACSVDRSYKSDIYNRYSKIPHVKIALVGDPKVGKTCIMLRYLKNQFSPMYIQTKKAVIENAVKKINVPGHAVVSLTVWDIPGREDMDLHKSYFRNLDAAIVVVDLTDNSSIEMAPVWKQTILNNTFLTHPVEEVKGHVQTTTMEETLVDSETFPILLMGNKFDFIEQRVQAERVKKYTKERDQIKEGDSERKVWSIGGPLTEEEKPECVKMMERQVKEHKFHGCMMVSARDGDGSVREAVQHLIRHVLASKYSMNKRRPKEKKEKKKDPKKIEFDVLEKVDIKEFDNIFRTASISIRKVEMLREYHSKSLTKMKEACQLAQILENGEKSLEDCIAAMKNNIGDGVKLKVKKDEEFCKLEADTRKEDFKLEKKMKIILNIFHTEYASVSNAIMKECPVIDSSLQQQDANLATMCQELWELVAYVDGQPRSNADVEKISRTIEENRAKIQHSWLECRAAVQIVEDSLKKIKASLLWTEE